MHRDFCEVAIAENGRVRSAGRIVTRVPVLELFAQSLGRDDVVALEATAGKGVSDLVCVRSGLGELCQSGILSAKWIFSARMAAGQW